MDNIMIKTAAGLFVILSRLSSFGHFNSTNRTIALSNIISAQYWLLKRAFVVCVSSNTKACIVTNNQINGRHNRQ
jgi:hypothetical protein